MHMTRNTLTVAQFIYHYDVMYLFFFCVLPADRVIKSLAHVVPVYKGDDGQSGGSKNCYGRNGSPTYVRVSQVI